MNLQEAVKSVLSQYAGFTGRARRSEFWFWELAVILTSIVAGILDAILGSNVIQIIVGLALIVPGLAVGARRLHDIGKSGWMQLIGIIPIVGWILVIVWYATDSVPDNEYGPNPKNAAGPAYGQMPPA